MGNYLINQHQAEQAWYAVYTSAPGDRINLTIGEYEGPFIIDHPLHIVGQAPMPVLWARRGPVIIVRSAGVQLENLCVEATFDAQDVAVLIESASAPVMQQIQLRGQVRSMNGSNSSQDFPSVIDLGDMAPQQPVSMWAEVTIPPSATVNAESDGPGVELQPLDNHGRYRLRIVYAPQLLRPQTLIRSQIELVGAGDPRRCWVIGRVLGGAAQDLATGDLMLTAGNRRFFIGQTFQIGKPQLQGAAGSSSLAACQALLSKNADGSWAIFQPGSTPHPTLVNGLRLWPGQRRLLPKDATIQVNALTLKVSPATAAAIALPPVLSFGAVTLPRVRSATCTLRNSQPGAWAGQVITTVPWLKARQPAVQCPGRGQAPIAVDVLPEVSQLPPGHHLVESGILVSDGEHFWPLDVEITIEGRTQTAPAPAPGITIDQTRLDLGDIAREGPYPTRTIQLRNSTPRDWDGTVWVRVPWITASPLQLHVASGQEQAIAVTLNEAARQLPVGALPSRPALAIVGDQTQQAITVSGTLTAPSPQPRVPQDLDFGVVAPQQEALRQLRIENHGAQAWSASVFTTKPWLRVTPVSITCPPHSHVELTVTLLAAAPVSSAGNVAHAIQINGEGGLYPVTIRYRTSSD